MDDFLKLLNGRLHSLANTHALLSRNRWHGVSLAELVCGELAPWMQDGNTLIDGPDIVLTAEATQPVSMVLHELPNNATKYGAFSNGHGRISVCWRRHSQSDARSKLVLEWQEAGGPSVSAANSHGYGTNRSGRRKPFSSGSRTSGLRRCLRLAQGSGRLVLDVSQRMGVFGNSDASAHL